MRDKKFYTAGEFAKKAGVTIRTIRFYDNKGLLKPSSLSEAGYRLYNDEDFAKLQRILTLKYLGFSLEDILMSISSDRDNDYLRKSLDSQLKIVKNKLEHMQLIEKSIYEAKRMFETNESFDWNKIINIIHVLNLERDIVEQYKDSTNLKVRINLHKNFRTNKYDWFNWVFDKLKLSSGEKILEIGCGDGQLWKSNEDKIPDDVNIVLADISEGMINDARDKNKNLKRKINFEVLDCNKLHYADASFDVVIANHMLFYIKDRDKLFSEIIRILKKGGRFYCSTYGIRHMKEIEGLAKSFDSKIALAEINLEQVFGLENGFEQLEPWFKEINLHTYEDSLIVDDYKPILDYILSCHGNEHEMLEGRYEEFEKHIKAKVSKTGKFRISKQAGMFEGIK
ncbi:methyltransferase domain-containing protein [Clostridium sp. YIM B02515]|uniref:Methyltransferase domain-containing protein n=1 Tax=Clostridium rhizosphaerae TaxID=2803861 RepID=A0ABS1T891_9CLOT|nr:methyltransferase domain-containing protein [Clostridium rhizosphaerae]MBL4935486.1 methyltransferase domain-containing protein [Clostridium rhizosphaerae]